MSSQAKVIYMAAFLMAISSIGFLYYDTKTAKQSCQVVDISPEGGFCVFNDKVYELHRIGGNP